MASVLRRRAVPNSADSPDSPDSPAAKLNRSVSFEDDFAAHPPGSAEPQGVSEPAHRYVLACIAAFLRNDVCHSPSSPLVRSYLRRPLRIMPVRTVRMAPKSTEGSDGDRQPSSRTCSRRSDRRSARIRCWVLHRSSGIWSARVSACARARVLLQELLRTREEHETIVTLSGL